MEQDSKAQSCTYSCPQIVLTWVSGNWS